MSKLTFSAKDIKIISQKPNIQQESELRITLDRAKDALINDLCKNI